MTHRRLRVLVIVFVATWILCSTFIYNVCDFHFQLDICYTFFFLYDIYKKPLWDQVMQNANANSRRHLKLAIDAFEFCVAVCRTSSLAVLHENKYRNLDEIYCFGLETPSI
ncbi:UPF0454 protein C12orf49 [Schistosoma japonicum]|nr:UPF0454 protein C12orf49 [Schistosoma japonicum]